MWPALKGRAEFELFADEYELRASGAVVDGARADCTVRANVETEVVLEVEPGREQKFRLAVEPTDPLPQRYSVEVRDADGNTAASERFDLGPGDWPRRDLDEEEATGLRRMGWLAYGLRPGEYRMSVVTDNGLRADVPFRVRAKGPNPEVAVAVRH